jgi:hypothetical protein
LKIIKKVRHQFDLQHRPRRVQPTTTTGQQRTGERNPLFLSFFLGIFWVWTGWIGFMQNWRLTIQGGPSHSRFGRHRGQFCNSLKNVARTDPRNATTRRRRSRPRDLGARYPTIFPTLW